jgi:opacity protein-like surface antigen
MKKLNLSLVAVLAMSTFAVAGGDIAPVEPVIETPIVMEESTGAFYLGLGYSMLNVEGTNTYDHGYNEIERDNWDEDFDEEGRYWFGLDETFNDGYGDYDISIDAWGIYVKPMYPVTEAFDIYALLGYGSAEADIEGEDTDSKDGFSWGIGAAYSFTDNVAVFVDYVSIYDDEETISAHEKEDITYDTVNFGVTYTF